MVLTRHFHDPLERASAAPAGQLAGRVMGAASALQAVGHLLHIDGGRALSRWPYIDCPKSHQQPLSMHRHTRPSGVKHKQTHRVEYSSPYTLPIVPGKERQVKAPRELLTLTYPDLRKDLKNRSPTGVPLKYPS